MLLQEKESKKIAEHLNIQMDDVKKLTILAIERILQEIANDEAQQRFGDIETMNEYRFFFIEYPLFVRYFGQELVDKHMVKIPLQEFKDTKYIKAGHELYGRSKFVEKTVHSFKRTSGAGSRSGATDNLPADKYEVPNQFQGLLHGKLLHSLLLEKYPWLQDFRFDVYEVHSNDNGVNEFYLQTEGLTLYVPFELFVNNDIEGILDRNKRYLTWRTNSDCGYQQLIKAPTVKSFIQHIMKQLA